MIGVERGEVERTTKAREKRGVGSVTSSNTQIASRLNLYDLSAKVQPKLSRLTKKIRCYYYMHLKGGSFRDFFSKGTTFIY